MDRAAWRATVCGVAKSLTWLNDWYLFTYLCLSSHECGRFQNHSMPGTNFTSKNWSAFFVFSFMIPMKGTCASDYLCWHCQERPNTSTACLAAEIANATGGHWVCRAENTRSISWSGGENRVSGFPALVYSSSFHLRGQDSPSVNHQSTEKNKIEQNDIFRGHQPRVTSVLCLTHICMDCKVKYFLTRGWVKKKKVWKPLYWKGNGIDVKCQAIISPTTPATEHGVIHVFKNETLTSLVGYYNLTVHFGAS